MSQRETKLTAPRKQRTSIRNAGYFTSTAPKTVELALYNGGLAVVREVRTLQLIKGFNAIYLEGLPTQFQPDSQLVLGYEGTGEVEFGTSTYRGANLDKGNILKNSVGETVTVKEPTSDGLAVAFKGVLKAVLGNEVVVERDNGGIVIVPTSVIELASLPPGLSATPTLVLGTTAKAAGTADVEFVYESGGLGWNARYAAFLDEKRGVLRRFECTVSLVNGSGARFPNALVNLFAANNYAQDGFAHEGVAMAAAAPMGGGGRRMSPKSFRAQAVNAGDINGYELPENVTLQDGDRQIATLFRAKNVPVKREYFLPSGNGYWNLGQGEPEKLDVNIRLRLKNDKLGSALPVGAVSVWQKDGKGKDQKVGNATVESHVSEGEDFKLEYGPAADIKAERRLVEVTEDPEVEEGTQPVAPRLPIRPLGGPGMPGDTSELKRQIVESAADDSEETAEDDAEAPRYREEEREVTIRNFKDEDVTVLVSEVVPENAEFLRTPEFDMLAEGATGHVVSVKVPAKDKTVVSYRLRWRLN